MKRLNSKTSKRCAELTARPFVRSLTGAVSTQYWSAGSQAGYSIREAEGALVQGIDVVRRLVLCSATENGDSASGVEPYSFSQEQCNAAAEAFVVFSLRYLETLVLAQFASVLQANGLWPKSAETPKYSVIEVTNNDQRTHAQHGVAGHHETPSRQLERACNSEESYTASSTSTGTTTVADTESSISSASGNSAVTESTQAGSISAFTDSAGANASTLAIASPSHCESQRIATRPTSGSTKDGPLSSPAASAVRKDSVGLRSAKTPFLSLFTINRFRKAAALKRAAAAKQLPWLLPGSNRRQVRAAEGLSLVWRSKAKAQLTLLKEQRLQLESKNITGLDSIGSTNDATTDSIRIADMREAAVDLVRKHQTRIKKVNVGRLADLLSACGLWPIQGHRLEQLIESEPRLQLHVKKREWYVTLSARGRAQKASASNRFSFLSIIHTTSSAAISPGIGFNNAQTTSGASPGAADADASAEKDQSASQGPVVELALRRLHAAAVQLLLDHKDNGNERMLTAVEVLKAHFAWHLQSEERASQSGVHLHALAIHLLDDGVWPLEGTTLVRLLQADARLEVKKSPLGWHLCLTPAMQAAMTARSAGSPVCDAMASPDATALSISSCATVQPGAASAPASPPLQQQAHERAQQASQLAGQQQAKLGTAFLAACQPEQQQQLPPGTSPQDVCTGLMLPHVSAFAAATASIGEMVCAAGGLTDAVSNGSTAGNEAASLQEQEAGPLNALSAQLDSQQKHAGSSRNPMHVMHVASLVSACTVGACHDSHVASPLLKNT